MNDFAQSVGAALSLIVHADPELLGIVTLSLRVSLTAGLAALLIGAPYAAAVSPPWPSTSVRWLPQSFRSRR